MNKCTKGEKWLFGIVIFAVILGVSTMLTRKGTRNLRSCYDTTGWRIKQIPNCTPETIMPSNLRLLNAIEESRCKCQKPEVPKPSTSLPKSVI